MIISGENLNNYLFKKERREFFHPEIQAELEFGLEQSKAATAAGMLENLRHFFAQDAEWDEARRPSLHCRGRTDPGARPCGTKEPCGRGQRENWHYQYACGTPITRGA